MLQQMGGRDQVMAMMQQMAKGGGPQAGGGMPSMESLMGSMGGMGGGQAGMPPMGGGGGGMPDMGGGMPPGMAGMDMQGMMKMAQQMGMGGMGGMGGGAPPGNRR
jgi:hypothetical protein